MQHDEEVAIDSTADRLADRAHDAIDSAHEQAQRFAHDVSEKKRAVEDSVDDAAARTGHSLRGAAERLRERGEQGFLGSAIGGVADTIDQLGTYLEEDAFARLRTDLEEMIRRNPLRSAVTCIGLGYLVARRMRS